MYYYLMKYYHKTMGLQNTSEAEFCTQTKIYKQKNNVFNSIAVTALLCHPEMMGSPIKVFLIFTLQYPLLIVFK